MDLKVLLGRFRKAIECRAGASQPPLEQQMLFPRQHRQSAGVADGAVSTTPFVHGGGGVTSEHPHRRAPIHAADKKPSGNSLCEILADSGIATKPAINAMGHASDSTVLHLPARCRQPPAWRLVTLLPGIPSCLMRIQGEE